MSLRPGDFVIKDRLPKAPAKYDQQNEHQFRRILELTRLESGTGAALADINAKVFEAYDHTGSGSTSGTSLHPTGSFRNAATTVPFYLGSTAGSGHPFAVVSGLALAARQSSGSDSALTLVPAWPVYSDLAGSGCDLTLVDAYRYTWKVVTERHAATAEFGIRNNTGAIAGASGNMGWAIKDNSGNWQLNQRLTSGGSVTTPTTNFTVTSTDPHFFVIEYTEYEAGTADCTFKIYVDGAIWYSTSGIANMPAQPASATAQYGPQVYGNLYTARNYLSVESMFELAAAAEAASAAIGGLRQSVTTVTATYSALVTDGVILANSTTAGFTITLPIATSMVGRMITVKKISSDANTVTIDGNGALIDGASTKTRSTQWDSYTMICNGINWYII